MPESKNWTQAWNRCRKQSAVSSIVPIPGRLSEACLLYTSNVDKEQLETGEKVDGATIEIEPLEKGGKMCIRDSIHRSGNSPNGTGGPAGNNAAPCT